MTSGFSSLLSGRIDSTPPVQYGDYLNPSFRLDSEGNATGRESLHVPFSSPSGSFNGSAPPINLTSLFATTPDSSRLDVSKFVKFVQRKKESDDDAPGESQQKSRRKRKNDDEKETKGEEKTLRGDLFHKPHDFQPGKMRPGEFDNLLRTIGSGSPQQQQSDPGNDERIRLLREDIRVLREHLKDLNDDTGASYKSLYLASIKRSKDQTWNEKFALDEYRRTNAMLHQNLEAAEGKLERLTAPPSSSLSSLGSSESFNELVRLAAEYAAFKETAKREEKTRNDELRRLRETKEENEKNAEFARAARKELKRLEGEETVLAGKLAKAELARDAALEALTPEGRYKQERKQRSKSVVTLRQQVEESRKTKGKRGGSTPKSRSELRDQLAHAEKDLDDSIVADLNQPNVIQVDREAYEKETKRLQGEIDRLTEEARKSSESRRTLINKDAVATRKLGGESKTRESSYRRLNAEQMSHELSQAAMRADRLDREDLQALSDNITERETQFKAMEKYVGPYNESVKLVEQLREEKRPLDERIGVLENEKKVLTEERDRLFGVAEKVDELEYNQEEFKQQIVTLTTTTTEQSTTIGELQTAASVAQTTIDGLRSADEVARTTIARLTTNESTLSERVRSLSTREQLLINAQQELQTSETTVATLRAAVGTKDVELDGIRITLALLEGKRETSADELKAIDARLHPRYQGEQKKRMVFFDDIVKRTSKDETEIEELKRSEQESKTEIERLGAIVEKERGRLGSIGSMTGEGKRNFDDVVDEVKKLTTDTLPELKRVKEDLERRRDNAATKYKKLQGEYKQSVTDAITNAEAFATLERERNGLATQVSDYQRDVTRLTSERNDAQTQLSTSLGKIAAANAELGGLKTSLGEVRARERELDGQISDLQSQKQALIQTNAKLSSDGFERLQTLERARMTAVGDGEEIKRKLGEANRRLETEDERVNTTIERGLVQLRVELNGTQQKLASAEGSYNELKRQSDGKVPIDAGELIDLRSTNVNLMARVKSLETSVELANNLAGQVAASVTDEKQRLTEELKREREHTAKETKRAQGIQATLDAEVKKSAEAVTAERKKIDGVVEHEQKEAKIQVEAAKKRSNEQAEEARLRFGAEEKRLTEERLAAVKLGDEGQERLRNEIKEIRSKAAAELRRESDRRIEEAKRLIEQNGAAGESVDKLQLDLVIRDAQIAQLDHKVVEIGGTLAQARVDLDQMRENYEAERKIAIKLPGMEQLYHNEQAKASRLVEVEENLERRRLQIVELERVIREPRPLPSAPSNPGGSSRNRFAVATVYSTTRNQSLDIYLLFTAAMADPLWGNLIGGLMGPNLGPQAHRMMLWLNLNLPDALFYLMDDSKTHQDNRKYIHDVVSSVAWVYEKHTTAMLRYPLPAAGLSSARLRRPPFALACVTNALTLVRSLPRTVDMFTLATVPSLPTVLSGDWFHPDTIGVLRSLCGSRFSYGLAPLTNVAYLARTNGGKNTIASLIELAVAAYNVNP